MRGSIGLLLVVLSLSSAGVVEGTEHWAELLDYDIGLAMGGIEGVVSSSNDCILVTYNRNYSTNDGHTVLLVMNLAGNLADSFIWDPPYVACYFADYSYWMTIENCRLMSDGLNAGWDQDTFMQFLWGRLLIQSGYAEIDADSQISSSVSTSEIQYAPGDAVNDFDYVNSIRPDVVSSIGNIARSRLLRTSDLAGLSYREIKLVRNYIYACYDRPFAVEWISDYYFQYMDEYSGDGIANPRLTSTESANIAFIQEYESDNDIPVIND